MEFFFFGGRICLLQAFGPKNHEKSRLYALKRWIITNCYDPSKKEGKPWVPQAKVYFFSVSVKKKGVPGKPSTPIFKATGLLVLGVFSCLKHRTQKAFQVLSVLSDREFIESSKWILDTITQVVLGPPS